MHVYVCTHVYAICVLYIKATKSLSKCNDAPTTMLRSEDRVLRVMLNVGILTNVVCCAKTKSPNVSSGKLLTYGSPLQLLHYDMVQF